MERVKSRSIDATETAGVSIVGVLMVVWFGLGGGLGCEGSREGAEEAAPPRGKLRVGTIHRLDGMEDGAPFRVEAPEGAELEIREAYLVVAAVELHACLDVDRGDAGDGGPSLNGLYELFVPPVRAHVPSSTTRLGTPFVDDLLGRPERARIAGAIAPPFGRYCRAVAVVAPADADVVNSTGAATESVVGASVLVRGKKRAGEDGDWESFEIRKPVRRTIEIDLVDSETGESPLALRPDESSAMVLFEWRISPEVFAVDPAAPEAAEQVVDGLADGAKMYTPGN